MIQRNFGRRPDTTQKAPPVKYSVMQRLSHFVKPKNYSYSSLAPVALDQGQSSSCVIHATAAVAIADSIKHKRAIDPSLLAWYAQAEQKYPPVGDNGLETGDGWSTFKQYGWIPRTIMPWPDNGYVADKLNAIPASAWVLSERPVSFAAVNPDIQSIKNAMYSHGPIIFGFYYAKEWMDVNVDGSLPVPVNIVGGHAESVFGWSDTIKLHDDASGMNSVGAFALLNSWGYWGIRIPGAKSKGWSWMPYYLWTDPQYIQFVPTDVYTVVMP